MGMVLRLGVIVLLGGLALAGCGVNGPLEPPGGLATDENRPNPAAAKAHHEPFILDGILR